MSIVKCYQAYHTYIMRASEITDILNAVTHGAVNRQMMAAPTLYTCYLHNWINCLLKMLIKRRSLLSTNLQGTFIPKPSPSFILKLCKIV